MGAQKKLLRRGVIQRREMKGEYGRVASVWYRYVEGQLPQPKYQYVSKADGTVVKVRT